MCNYVERLYFNIGHNLTQKFLTTHLCFKKYKFVVFFSKRHNLKTRHCPKQFFFYFFNLHFFLSHGVSLLQWSHLQQSRHQQTRLLQFQLTHLVVFVFAFELFGTNFIFFCTHFSIFWH